MPMLQRGYRLSVMEIADLVQVGEPKQAAG